MTASTAGSDTLPNLPGDQDEASRAGIAPAMHKIVEGDALRELYRRDPVLAGLRSPWTHSPDSPPVSMVEMDVVHDGFSFMQWQRSRRPLDRYPVASLPAWTARLRAIEDFLNRHHVQMVDEQFLIQPDGNVVIDFDHYTYWRVPTPGAKLNDVGPNIAVLRGLFGERRAL